MLAQYCSADCTLKRMREDERSLTRADCDAKKFYSSHLRSHLPTPAVYSFSDLSGDPAFLVPCWSSKVTPLSDPEIAKFVNEMEVVAEGDVPLSDAVADFLVSKFVTRSLSGYDAVRKSKVSPSPLPDAALSVARSLLSAKERVASRKKEMAAKRKKHSTDKREATEAAVKKMEGKEAACVPGAERGVAYHVRCDVAEKTSKFGIKDLQTQAKAITKDWVEKNSLSDDLASSNVVAIQNETFKAYMCEKMREAKIDKEAKLVKKAHLTCILADEKHAIDPLGPEM